jgi:hypothetical protein
MFCWAVFCAFLLGSLVRVSRQDTQPSYGEGVHNFHEGALVLEQPCCAVILGRGNIHAMFGNPPEKEKEIHVVWPALLQTRHSFIVGPVGFEPTS